jgi:hypothetical protein
MKSPERFERVKQMIRDGIPADGIMYGVSEENRLLDPHNE